MIYSSRFGGASLPPSLGRGACHAGILRRPTALDVPTGGVARRSAGKYLRAGEKSATRRAATGEGDFDFQGSAAAVVSGGVRGGGGPRGVHGFADSRHFRL